MKHVMTRVFPDGTEERIVFRISNFQVTEPRVVFSDRLFADRQSIDSVRTGPGAISIEGVVDSWELTGPKFPKRKPRAKKRRK